MTAINQPPQKKKKQTGPELIRPQEAPHDQGPNPWHVWTYLKILPTPDSQVFSTTHFFFTEIIYRYILCGGGHISTSCGD